MRKLLALLAIAVSCLHAQAQNVEGQIIASQYQYLVAGYAPNTYSWPGGTCNASGPQKQFAFYAGAPITIVDGNPALTENVTPTATLNNNQTCAISIAPVNNHQVPFSIKSATGGLQEALNLNMATPATNTVILNAAWYQSVGSANATAVIAAAKGSAQLNLVDITTTPYNWYAWNGSQYVLTTIAGQSLATYNVPGLQGGGRCFVYPSMITTDVFALINSCSAQLPAAGGLIDATALGTANYTVTTQLTALNNANQAVVLLLNPGTTFTINTSFTSPTNSPASCAVPVGPASQPNGGSAIIVPSKNAFGGSNFVLGPSARVWDVVCNGNFTGDQESLKLDGVYVQGNQSATMSGALMHLAGVFTPTSIVNSGTLTCFGQCLELDAGTTGTGGAAIGDLLFENDLFQDTYTGSATYPGSVVKINGLTNQSGAGNINFVGGMIQANGPHNPLLVIEGHGSYQVNSIGFFGTTFQGAAASTSVANPNVDPIQLTDVSSVLITNLRFAGNNNNSAQQNLIDINGTVQNAQYGININQVTAFTGNFQCLIKNNVDGTCESGYPNGAGDTALPNYTYGQFFPQIRQTNVAPPTTPGQCVVGSIWTNSSATTAAQSALICAGTPGNQVYVSFGGGGGGGGGLGTLQNDLVGNNAGNTAAVDLLNFFSGSSYTEQQAINAAFTNVGVATLMPKAIPAPFTNLNNASVVDLEHPAARTSSVTNFGAQCDARTVALTFSASSTTITIHNDFFRLPDVGKTIAAVGAVGGIPTAYEAKITSIGAGPTSSTATVDTTTPFAQTSAAFSPLGTDDTAAIQQAFNQAKTPPPGLSGYLSATALTFPASACLSHTVNYTGVSFQGLDPVLSRWIGFPGETILLSPDPSLATAAPGNGVHIHDITASVDNRIDATLPWQIINVSGTTSRSALYQPAGILSPASNSPSAPGWMQGALANSAGAIIGVGAINSGSPTSMTVPAGVTLPVATNVIVFPYLPTVFTTTVSSVNTGTRVVTLAGSYPGSTGAQIEWWAGTSAQKLGANYSGSGCPTTMTLTNPITPAPGFESNVAPFGLVQVGAEQFSYFFRTNAANLGSQFLTITGCAQNGTSRAAHSTNDTVVPLNQFKPSTPWPVTPTINSGTTTPVNAAFYPAWNVGNGFFEAPVSNGASGSSAVESLVNSLIENIYVISYPTSDPINHNTGWYLVNLPYSTRFSHMTMEQTYFGIEEGVPAFNAGGGWAASQPTADGTSWDAVRISSCNVMDMVAGNQNSYKDFNVYSSCESSPGVGTGAQTAFYFTSGWNDFSGGTISVTNHAYFSNLYAEPEQGSLYGAVPVFTFDCYVCNWDDMHIGGGGETYIGGGNQHWSLGNFNASLGFPVINNGVGNGSDGTELLFINNGVGNTYGSSAFIDYGRNSSFSGPTSNPNPLTAFKGNLSYLTSREPVHGQNNDTFNFGNLIAPLVNSNGGYIPASEWNTDGNFEAQPFPVQWYYDPTSASGGTVGCIISNSAGCLSYKWNQIGVQVGPGQRFAAGKYTLYLQVKSSGAASQFQLTVGVCTPGDVATLTVPVTSGYTWYSTQVDFTGKGTCGGSIALGFFYISGSADTISVGAADFAPVWQQPVTNNLQVQNQLIDNTGSAGTSTYVWTSQGSGSPNHWAASAGGISGGTTNTLSKYSSATTLIPSLWTDNGTTSSYSGTGGISVTATTPGKWSLICGTGSIPSLASGSFGFAAPNCSGTPYLFKPPATITQGFLFAASPGTNDGVNESALTSISVPATLPGGSGAFGTFTSGTYLAGTKMPSSGTFTNIQVTNVSTSSCTGAPTINVGDFTTATTGTGVVGSTTGAINGSGSARVNGNPNFGWSAGDEVYIFVQTTGSTCPNTFSVTAQYVTP